MTLKPLFYLVVGIITILLAFVVVFIPPVAIYIPEVIAFIAPILQSLGFVNFRTNYGNMKAWFKSKTIVGSLVVMIPALALAIFPFINFTPVEWLDLLLRALVIGGGGTAVLGIFDVIKKQKQISK